MEYFYDNNKLSMPEQVNKNTADIAELKKVSSTPAVMYNASVEIATDAGVVSQSDVIETVTTTDNSYIMDTVGSLFKVISIASGNIYILYVSSIRGIQGIQGEQGVPGTPINPYPVNSIYMSVVDTDPSILFGGTWEQLKDRFLLGAGDTYTNGATGGSADAVVVEHKHKYLNAYNGSNSASFDSGSNNSNFVVGHTWGATNTNPFETGTEGESGVDKNMPPYLVVYMWKRIA